MILSDKSVVIWADQADVKTKKKKGQTKKMNYVYLQTLLIEKYSIASAKVNNMLTTSDRENH
ncbi:hypothetical protein CMK18_15640 [Candidatus Poribacteria bacterium]|nr:hypothetical protein [Candidatus Poribacteria bacterium]